MSVLEDLPDICSRIIEKIRENFPERPAGSQSEADRYALGVAEEVGELIGAYNRLTGSRRTGTIQELDDESADVIITTVMLMLLHDRDVEAALNNKLQKIFSRDWREAEKTPGILP